MGKQWRVGVVLAVAVLVLPACSSGHPEHWPPGVRAGSGHAVTAELAGRQAARLDLVSGASVIVVRTADLGGALFRAWTPDGARVLPAATVDGDAVRVSLHDSGDSGTAELHVELSRQVSWQLRLDGGADQQSLDLREGRLAGLEFGAGSTRIDAILPHPERTVPVRMTGGASVLDLHLPDGVPATVLIGGGAAAATIDGATRTGIAGGTTLSAGDTGAPDRYQVDLTAGVSALSLDRIRA